MKKIIALTGICLLAFWFQSCRPARQAVTTTITPVVIEKERVVNKPFDVVWQNTIELLATYNMPIKNLDKNSGFISTEYKLITSNPAQYAYFTGANSTFTGKVELTNHGGNLNVLLKRITPDSTRVTVNCFYSCNKNKYKYAGLLSTTYVLESSQKVDAETTGNLEKAILEYISTR